MTSPQNFLYFLLREAGVTSIVSFNMHVRFNGEYYGKFGFVEQIDEDTLQV